MMLIIWEVYAPRNINISFYTDHIFFFHEVLPAETEIKMASLWAMVWFMAQFSLCACKQRVASHWGSAHSPPHSCFGVGNLSAAGGAPPTPPTLLEVMQFPPGW